MEIVIDESIRQMIPGCRLGFILIRGAAIKGLSAALTSDFLHLQSELAEACDLEGLPKLPRIVAVRNMYRKLCLDPARYRPASEALMRRVLQNKRLYFVNSAVDVNNYCSLKFLFPFGLYDAGKISGSVTYRVADEGSYLNIGGQEASTGGKPFLTDDEGVFGNPTSDSRRTAVTLMTVDLLSVAYPDELVSDEQLLEVLDFAGKALVRYNGGSVAKMAIAGAGR